ncbi:hypothetical protein KUTeg_012992 [Tegillarca granosa]|uniref:Kringle domain-containing protein n=1 Tax=Tegillarca granosa TaxID=220873 RepID=A0ABQ9ESE4_TEGGR|nr:hypothetical protein KUTeg_012992 [Tegillarca granosa]
MYYQIATFNHKVVIINYNMMKNTVMDLGLTCQRWEKQSYHQHRYTHFSEEENFCRDADESLPTCYSSNYYVRWGHCDIPRCSKYCCYVQSNSSNGDKAYKMKK